MQNKIDGASVNELITKAMDLIPPAVTSLAAPFTAEGLSVRASGDAGVIYDDQSPDQSHKTKSARAPMLPFITEIEGGIDPNSIKGFTMIFKDNAVSWTLSGVVLPPEATDE